MRRVARGLVLLLLVLLAGERPPPPTDQLGNGPHASPAVGVQFHGTWAELSGSDQDRILDALVEAGVRWIRVDIGWSMIQPSKGRYDQRWGVPRVDSVLAKAKARDLQVLAMFWSTPDWANDGAGKRVMPDDPTDYAKALRWAAKRWKGQVAAWEIWNEPNSDEFLKPPSAENYVTLLRVAYPAVKSVADVPVVFGGLMYVDLPWLERAYAAGARGSFDVMAVHPYQGLASLPPEAPSASQPQRLTTTRALIETLSAHGDGELPIWFTEFGWSVHSNTAGTPRWFQGVSDQEQAEYLRRTLVLVRLTYPQVTNVFWYTARDTVTGRAHADRRGLLRRDFSARPALGVLRCYIEGCRA